MAEVEYLLLANHAEAANGLLNVLGAGWTDHWRGQRAPGTPAPLSHFGIGISVLVPWTETNRPHHLVLRIEAEDGPELARVESDLEIGRPPGIAPGSDQRAVLGLNVNMQFPAPGGYRLVAEVGHEIRTASFRVHDQAPPN